MNPVLLVPFAALVALVFSVVMTKRVLKFNEGSEKMKSISSAIRKGANAYLKRQTKVVAIFFSVFLVILCVLAALGYVSVFLPFAFVSGGLVSGLSGFVGMKVATAANARTANAASKSLNRGLRIAFSAGSVMGFTVVGLGLLNVSIWYFLLYYGFKISGTELTAVLLAIGMGASFMALFARVGGGIFTKAADVGADLVGKIEAGIPEDDPRNPAVIADNVGDNVGDVAGMGADLYESYIGAIISCMALGSAAFHGSGRVTNAVIMPMVMAAIGIIASILGTFLVRTKEKVDQKSLLSALRRGTNVSAILTAAAAFPLIWFTLGKEHIGIYGAVLSGLLAGILIGICTEHFTSDSHNPTKHLSDTSETGSATIIIGGLSLGMISTALPVIVIGAAVLASFFFSGGTLENPTLGLYSIAVAAAGMLSTLGITLATDAYGPIADNAGGIAQMSGMDESVRQRTDALDSLGNTTAATGKGFAIGSAALTALALIAAYKETVDALKPGLFNPVITDPRVLVGL
ncbi:MAG: sodium-translocating pyrophosphatase, partial [Defluviitaleaceae bacterium]|nr:sodium-translocating pyrophosphatase [Defluviitaleaceae bacterium]